MRNFSESCLRNQAIIFEQLQPWLQDASHALEIGSGSGQHAQFFCQHLPTLQWQCTDKTEWLAGLQENIAAINLSNISAAIELDVNNEWPDKAYDLIYTANSLHIMSWQSVKNLFSNLSQHLQPQGYFCCYGPMKYQQKFTSDSNANFDLWLKNRDAASGIRDFEALQLLADKQKLKLIKDINMPANNQLLIWQHW